MLKYGNKTVTLVLSEREVDMLSRNLARSIIRCNHDDPITKYAEYLQEHLSRSVKPPLPID